MNRFLNAILFVCLMLFASASVFSAGTLDSWVVFKDYTTGNVINADGDGKYGLSVNQKIKAEVWLKSSDDFTIANTAFGWGTASSLGGSDTSNNGYGNFILDPVYSESVVATTALTKISGPIIGGFKAPLGVRAYGDRETWQGGGTVLANTAQLMATYILTNNMGIVGQTGQIGIYNYFDGSYFAPGKANNYTPTNVAKSGAATLYAPTMTYELSTIPEPSSLMAMGCAGVGVLGNLLRRRRKKK